MIQASTILDSAAGTLLDTAHRTWALSELLRYLNEALRATAFVKPDFYVVENDVALVAGITQVLPDDGIAVINIKRNRIIAPDTGVERVITQCDSGLLDESNRFWPAGTPTRRVEHFTADPRNPRHYDVFPPNDGTGLIVLVYGAVPPTIMYEQEEMQVPDSFAPTLENYVLGRAYEKNAKRQDLSKSAAYYQRWGQALGLKSQAQIAIAAKVASEPGTT